MSVPNAWIPEALDLGHVSRVKHFARSTATSLLIRTLEDPLEK
jgi:hypothetical protein